MITASAAVHAQAPQPAHIRGLRRVDAEVKRQAIFVEPSWNSFVSGFYGSMC